MTVNRDKHGRYTVISDEHTFLVVDKPRAAAAKILRENFTSVRVDNILDDLASDSDWRRVFLAAAAKHGRQYETNRN